MKPNTLTLTVEDVGYLIALAIGTDPRVFSNASPDILSVIYKCKARGKLENGIVTTPGFKIIGG